MFIKNILATQENLFTLKKKWLKVLVKCNISTMSIFRLSGKLKRITGFLILSLAFFQTFLSAQPIKVAVAANVQNAVEEISEIFYNKYKINVQLIVSSSGKLTAQIKNGAPYDVFISADIGYPQEIFKSDLSFKPKVYAWGSLVLWSMRGIDVKKGFSVLLLPDIIKISIPNPDLAPYGRAAMEALRKQKQSEKIILKLVYSENVTQSNQFIQTGAVDAGFTALSSVLDPNLEKKGNYWVVDRNLYSPIEQAACLLQYGKKNHPKESELFFNFLFSPEAGKIFKKYGYRIPEK